MSEGTEQQELLRLLCDAVEAYEDGKSIPRGIGLRLIYSGRNRIYQIGCGGRSYVLKCFAPARGLQRLACKLGLKRSKAEKSHLNSLALEARGIGVAPSIGYTHRLRPDGSEQSYHLSLDLSASVPHLQAHARGWAAPEGFMPALAAYLVAVHDAGVEHLDLSPGNILYSRDAKGAYRFAMVDLNRMVLHQHALTRSEAIANMSRLMNTRSTTRSLAYHYALVRGWEPLAAIEELTRATDDFWSARYLKLSYRYAKSRYGMGLLSFVAMYIRYRFSLLIGDRVEGARLYRRYLQREDIRHIERQHRGFGYQYQD